MGIDKGELGPGFVSSSNHHGSHNHLLHRPTVVVSGPRARVDAIVVPTARNVASLNFAIGLAAQLRCPLVALCSKWSSIRATEERALAAGAELVAIEMTGLTLTVVPEFTTTKILANTPFERRQDTSLKRNLGLLLAHLIGWQRVVFLDDDIHVPTPGDLLNAVALLDSFTSVGLANAGFPDNSVVCHAFRFGGGRQDTFIGGGALAVDTSSLTSFFPKIYNEDWFYLLDDTGLRPTAVTGLAFQKVYNPFANEHRARMEELGDCLAEGVFWLLDRGHRIQDANAGYWQEFLDRRRAFISEVIRMVDERPGNPAAKARIITTLKAARGRSHIITPARCVDYLDALRGDRIGWQRHVDDVRQKASSEDRDPEKVLSNLGLLSTARYLPPGKHRLAG